MKPEGNEERRREFRLNKVLGAVLITGDEAFRARIFVINISRTGLKATHQTPIPDHDGQALQLFLNSKDQPLETQVKVAWQKELALSGMFEIGFQFLTMSEADQERLDDFIITESKPSQASPVDLSSPWKFGKTAG